MVDGDDAKQLRLSFGVPVLAGEGVAQGGTVHIEVLLR